MEQKPLLKISGREILPKIEEIEIYHDEIKDDKNNPVAHGFLCVPSRVKEILIQDLLYWRSRHRVNDYKLNFKNLSGTRLRGQYGCARDWLNCLVRGMADKEYLSPKKWEKFPLLGLRYFAIFMPTLDKLSDDYFQWINKAEKRIRKFETLLRIGLKGGLHYLYSPEYQAKIIRFSTDAGAFHRQIDNVRIIKKLEEEKRDYIEFDENLQIESLQSNHKDKLCKDEAAAHLLQLLDLTLGSTCFCCMKGEHPIKTRITNSIKELLDKRKRGRNFIHSSHYKTYTVSICDIIKDKWKFDTLDTKITKDINQLDLNLDI